MSFEPPIRPASEIQKAHDTLAAVILREIPIELKAQNYVLLRAQLDALCWVLKHAHNASFAELLRLIDAEARAKGFEMREGPPPHHQG